MKKVSKKEVRGFVDSLQSLQFYTKTKQAFTDVLSAMSQEDFEKATKNLVVVALHEGCIGQMMHFPNFKGQFKVMQLTMPYNVPISVMRYVIAHELGHGMQGRNWREGDGHTLEEDADQWAEKWGFKRTKKIFEYQKKFWKNPKC